MKGISIRDSGPICVMNDPASLIWADAGQYFKLWLRFCDCGGSARQAR
jgi:hypothetical protein